MVKVSPVIEGGAYPAKAAVGESIPIRAQVFREGHDAVNASVVLTDPEGQETLVADAPDHPGRLRLVDRLGRAGQRGAVDLPGRGLERPVGDLGAQRRDQDPGRDRRRPGLHRGQGPVHRLGRAGRRRPGDSQTAALLRGAAKSLDSGQQVEDRLEVVLADDVRGAMATLRTARAGLPHPGLPDLRRPPGGPVLLLVRVLPPLPGRASATRRTRPGSPAPSTPRTSAWRRRRRWASTWSTSRRSTRSAATFRKGANNTLTPGPGDPGSPWAIGSRGGRPRHHPSRPGRLRRLRPVRGQGQVARPGGRAWTSRCRPRRTIRGSPSTRSGSPSGPTARIAYAENPPKKYQDIYPINFDNDRDGIYLECAADPQAVDEPRRPDLPGRQPAHQAGQLLGLAARRDPQDRPRRALPVRGLHQAGDDAGAGQGRLPAGLHLLHLAQREVGDRGVHEGADHRDGQLLPAQLLGQHPRHPAQLPAVGRQAGLHHPGRAGRDPVPADGGLLRLRAVRERRARPGPRGVPGLGEVPVPAAGLAGGRRRAGRTSTCCSAG